MHDETLSRAVETYIWGTDAQPWPSTHPDAVQLRFGHQADDLIARVDRLLAEIYETGPDWTREDLNTAANRVHDALRQNHPELNDEATKALIAHFTYMLK